MKKEGKKQSETQMCRKCKTDGEIKGSVFIEGGEEYYFCRVCSSILKDLPTNSNIAFIKDKNLEMVKNPILKNILKSRLQRSKKKFLWANPSNDIL